MADKDNRAEATEVVEGLGMTENEAMMNEDALIRGLINAAQFKDDPALWAKMHIKRNGVTLFEFRIRPLEEEETQDIRKRCTKKVPNPNGRHLPMIDGDVNFVKLRSLKIYEATVDEDKKKTWDNSTVQKALNCLDPIGVIDQVLMAGEKDAIIEQIDAISGFGAAVEDAAKN